MDIIDLSADLHEPYFHCLEEDWSDDIKEGRDQKAKWFENAKGRGLRVKLAKNDQGIACGMIQYQPIEESFAQGLNLYLINCIWVHGHKEGKGNLQKRGAGITLLKAAEEDAKALGAAGIAAWGLWLPIWMKASWFKKQGYRKADRDGIRVLVWKSFTEKAEAPKWIRQKKKPELVPDKVTVSAFVNGWCTAQNMVYERAKRASSEFGQKVIFKEYNTSDRNILLEWGISDGLFINRKVVRTGPPPSYESIKKQIEKQVRKLIV